MRARTASRERTYAWMVEPESLGDLCDFLSDGGTLSEYTLARRIKYRMVLAWLSEAPERWLEYQSATTTRSSAMQDQVLASLRNASSIDPRELFDKEGNLRGVQDMPDGVAHSLTEVAVSKDKNGETTTRIKFTPRNTANQELGKHLGMFDQRVNLNVTGSVQHAHDLSQLSEHELLALREIKGKLEQQRLLESVPATGSVSLH